jgi:hypothetical protein
MKDPYLIQRLKKPFKIEKKNSTMVALANAFSFGGGLINGGLSKYAMKLLNDIWRYDYMGSSEFEWGAIPESLQEIAKNIKNYISGEMEVTGKIYDYSYDYSTRKEIQEKATIYYMCTKENEKEICEWIKKFSDDKKRNYNTKESVNLADNICKIKCCLDIVGWHDIKNHYLFFTDKEMFEKSCNLFGCKTTI